MTEVETLACVAQLAKDRRQDEQRYDPSLESLPEPARKLLEEYAHIPADRVLSHVVEVRKQAWEVFPYPCIGRFRFLDLNMSSTPHYPEVVERLKDGQKLLDLGCCFGQEIRQLVSEGVPSSRLYGSDLRLDFIKLGYSLFLDKDTINASFIAADIFDPDSDLKQIDGQIDIVHASSFFHLFSWTQQLQMAKRVAKILRPRAGSLVMGRQGANVKPGEYARKSGGGSRYRHNGASWEEMWKQVGEETGTSWVVETEMGLNPREVEEVKRFGEDGVQWMKYLVRRE